MADTSLLFNIIGKDRTGPAFRSAAGGASRLGSTMKRGLLASAAALGVAAGGVAALGVKMVQEARESAKIMRLTENVVRSTGKAANISAADVAKLAGSISNLTGVDDEAIQSGQNLLLTFTGIRNEVGKGNDIFNQTSQAAVDMTAALNNGDVSAENIKSSALQLGKALNDPVKGLTALTRSGVSFTEQQKAQIKALTESGDKLGAQKIILGELKKEFGGAARAASDPMSRLRTIMGNLGEDIGTMLLPSVEAAATFIGERLVPAAYRLIDALKPVARGVKVFFRALGGGSEANEFSGKLRTANNAGVKLGNWIRNDFMPVARRLGSWFKNDAIPAVKKFATEVWANLKPNIQALAQTFRTHILPAVKSFIGKVREAWPTIKRLADILLTLSAFLMRRVMPVLIKLAGPILGTVIRVVGQTISTVFRLIGVFMDLGKGVANAVTSALGIVKRLPGQVVRAIGSLAKTLWQHGLDLIQGFIDGIVQKAKDLPGIIKDQVVGVAKSALHGFGLFGSPSRLTMKYGRWWTEGFAIGMKDGSQDIVDRAQEMVDKLKEKLQTVKDFAQQVKDTFASFADVTSIDTLISGENGDTEGGFAKLLADLQGRAAGAAKFNSALRQLRKLGLNETTIAQLRESGPEQGLKSAQQILGAGAGGVGQVNNAVRSILASGTALGNREAKALYGIDPSKPQKLKVTVGGDIKITADVGSFIKVLRKEIRAKGGNVQSVLGAA